MSVNFYDGSGLCVGFDLHTFPYVTTVPSFAYWLPCTFYKHTGTVTSDGWKMIQDGCDWYLVPHVPIPPNNPPALIKLVEIMPSSSSKAFMSVHSVTGEGTPLATALWGPAGLNAHCWDPGLALPTGAVLQLNSVKTSPSLGDYLGAAAGLVADNIIGFALEKGLMGVVGAAAIKHLVRRLPDIAEALGIEGDVVSWVVNTPGQVKSLVQQLVDG